MSSSFQREGEIAPPWPLNFPQPEAETIVVKFKVNLKFKKIISALPHRLLLWQEASPGGSERVLPATEGGDSWRQLKENQSCDTFCPALSAGLQQLQKDTVAAAR